MPSLRQIRSKITSAKGTKRIMSAMKLISAVKLQRAQGLLLAMRPYSDAYQEIAKNIALRCDAESHPLLRRPLERKRLHLVFMTSDRGLCGSFNSGLIRKIENYIVQEAGHFPEITFSFIGRRGRDYFSRRKPASGQRGDLKTGKSFTGVTERNFSHTSGELAADLAREFSRGECDEIVLVYNRFKSAISQFITFERVLPIEPDAAGAADASLVDYIYEPGRREVIDAVLPKYIEARIDRAVLESVTSEHGARMTAMENATKNAQDIIKRLTLVFNKTRQAIITKELMDIVNGTESMKKSDMV
ncbi:MAG: ATP synthase F1 subunit gamma [Deltaproteobacteria bacterium]